MTKLHTPPSHPPFKENCWILEKQQHCKLLTAKPHRLNISLLSQPDQPIVEHPIEWVSLRIFGIWVIMAVYLLREDF